MNYRQDKVREAMHTALARPEYELAVMQLGEVIRDLARGNADGKEAADKFAAILADMLQNAWADGAKWGMNAVVEELQNRK